MRKFIALLFALSAFACRPSGGAEDHARLDLLSLPKGFGISIFAEGLEGPRFMAFGPGGTLYVTLTRAGRVLALPDVNGDGTSDRAITAASGLNNPHGIAFFEGRLYIAETDKVVRFRVDPKDFTLHAREVMVPELPSRGGGHFTRTVAFGPDGMMYVSVGSSCNVCVEKERGRASVMRFSPDGSGGEVFAEGLRNSVGLVFHPATGELFATENGRDWLGDDLPPDEINIIKRGRHYGWPYCYGRRVEDPFIRKFKDKKGFCDKTEPSEVDIQAHSAPLGLEFYTADAFPKRYRGGLFVALHGSWNRTIPTGYKIIFVPFRGGRPSNKYEDFITGWLSADAREVGLLRRLLDSGPYWGRPADVIVTPGGDLFISDDYSGTIYRVVYKGT